jgi:hypothetical protein
MSNPEYSSPTDLPAFKNQRPETETVTLQPAELFDGSHDPTLIVGKLTCSTVNEVVEQPTFRQRCARSRLARVAFSGLTVVGVTSAATFEASPAFADDSLVHTVVNPGNDDTRSIYDRNSPNWADSNRTAPDFAYYGDRVELICGMDGEAVGPNNNKRWHYARNLSRPEAGVTWIPDRYTNTPNKANEQTPGEEECLAPPPKSPILPKLASVPVKGCYFNMKAPSTDLTFSYEGAHRYLGNAKQGAKDWTDLNTGITIEYDSDDAYIRFKDIYSTDKDHQWYAQVDIPDGWERVDEKYLTEPPKNPHEPSYVTVYINQAYVDKLSDFHRTYVFGHEIAHTLGMARPNECGVTDKTIAQVGGDDVPNRTISPNTTTESP